MEKSLEMKKTMALKEKGLQMEKGLEMEKAKDLNVLYSSKFPNLLEDYDLLKRIGEGGQAIVFKCKRVEDGKEFACKTTSKNTNYVRTEMEIMHKLASCPGIVHLEEVINDKDSWHFIMELCECSLADRIEKKGKLSEPECALLIQNLAKTLENLHANGVVHRDLKPANVLISLGGKPYNVKVSDFGLSACSGALDPPYFSKVVGTQRYLAPEVVGGRYSKEIDIWGLGIILYEALTGWYAFSKLESWDVQRRLANGEDLTVSHLDFPSDISYEAKDLVLAMLQPNPANRISLQQILSHPWVLKHSLSESVGKRSNCRRNPFVAQAQAKRQRIQMQQKNQELAVRYVLVDLQRFPLLGKVC